MRPKSSLTQHQRTRLYRDIAPIVENQMEKKMESDMETGSIG